MLFNMLKKASIVILVSATVFSCANSNQIGNKMNDEIYPGIFLQDEYPPILTLESEISVNDLKIVDLIEGSGRSVSLTDTLEVDYLGIGGTTKLPFDSTFSRNQTAVFPLAAVIAGWQEGLEGMQEGGRRLLIIPGPLAYGENPPPNSGIQPNETLIFLVDLIEIQ
jgi:FKBP-type peptidyl-prolyl cis-trans isomerase